MAPTSRQPGGVEASAAARRRGSPGRNEVTSSPGWSASGSGRPHLEHLRAPAPARAPAAAPPRRSRPRSLPRPAGWVDAHHAALPRRLGQEGLPGPAALQRGQRGEVHGSPSAPCPAAHRAEVAASRVGAGTIGRMGTPYDRPVRVERRAVDERGVARGQRTRLGPLRRRVPGHPRQLPRRRRLPVGAGGADRGRGGGARRGQRQGRARGRLGRRPVLTLGARARRARRRHRPVAPPAPALPAHRRGDRGRGAGGARHRDRAAVRRRQLRRRVLLVRGAAVRRPTSTTRSPRPPGCCAAAAASRSRSRTRPGGCSPTTRAEAG